MPSNERTPRKTGELGVRRLARGEWAREGWDPSRPSENWFLLWLCEELGLGGLLRLEALELAVPLDGVTHLNSSELRLRDRLGLVGTLVLHEPIHENTEDCIGRLESQDLDPPERIASLQGPVRDLSGVVLRSLRRSRLEVEQVGVFDLDGGRLVVAGDLRRVFDPEPLVVLTDVHDRGSVHLLGVEEVDDDGVLSGTVLTRDRDRAGLRGELGVAVHDELVFDPVDHLVVAVGSLLCVAGESHDDAPLLPPGRRHLVQVNATQEVVTLLEVVEQVARRGVLQIFEPETTRRELLLRIVTGFHVIPPEHIRGTLSARTPQGIGHAPVPGVEPESNQNVSLAFHG